MKKGAVGRGKNMRHGACAENNDWFSHSMTGGCIKDVIGSKIGATWCRVWILRAKAIKGGDNSENPN